MIALILYVIAAVCFALATFAAPVGRINLVALGLLCAVALVPLTVRL